MTDPFAVGRSLRSAVFVVFLGMAFSLTANAQAPEIEWTLKEALKEIERQAKDFKTALARAEVVRRDPQGNETSRGSGNVYIDKDGKIRYDVDDQGRTLLVERNRVSIYPAAAEQVEPYSLFQHHRQGSRGWLLANVTG
jgi:outer membrane lipoprotein-sorting protein